MAKRKLPERFDLRITYDKQTKTYFAECLDDPNIYALTTNRDDLIDRINAAIYDSYGIGNREAKKMGLKYKVVIVEESGNSKQTFSSGRKASGSRKSQTVSLSSSFPVTGCV
jgi:hypothetical protein